MTYPAPRLRKIVQWGYLIALAIALLWVPATANATPTDTLTTETYLQASDELDHAVEMNAAASKAASSQYIARIIRECHGVLAGAPNEETDPMSFPPRVRGERQRGELQLVTIENELSRAFFAAADQPDRAAIEAYVTQTAPLSWSDPQVAVVVHSDTQSLQEDLAPAPPACADMRAWAQSGYRTLSPTSLAFQAAQKALAAAPRPTRSIDSLLGPYEDAGERRLIKRLDALRSRTKKAFKAIDGNYLNLQRSLGLPEREPEAHEHEKILGRGKTEAGETFVVREESSKSSRSGSCPKRAYVELTRTSAEGESSGSGNSVCLSDQAPHQPPTACSGEGVWTVTAAVPASVWAVRLRLRLGSGRTITSKVVRVSVRDGGPGGVYVQSLRPHTPPAISLTELDQHGKVVHLVKLTFESRCEVEHGSHQGPTFVQLVHGTTPGGQPFTIQGVLVHASHNQDFFNLSLETTTEKGTTKGEDEGGIEIPTKPRIFSWSLATGCPPHTYSIVYGTLAAPGTSVSALTPGGLVPLTEVQLASNLHAEGPLFYGVFSTPPSELIVQGGNGVALSTESLTAKAQEEREFCEGYGEG